MSNVQFTNLSILQMPKNRERESKPKLSGLMYDSCPLLQYCHVILSYDLVVLAANTKVEPLLMASAKCGYSGVCERDTQREGSHKHLNVRLIILTHDVISPPGG